VAKVFYFINLANMNVASNILIAKVRRL